MKLRRLLSPVPVDQVIGMVIVPTIHDLLSAQPYVGAVVDLADERALNFYCGVLGFELTQRIMDWLREKDGYDFRNFPICA